MSSEFTATIICPDCGIALPSATDRCPQCGEATTGDTTAIGSPTTKGRGSRTVLDNRWIILGTLFFVTAALGLPFLWISRAFSRSAKAVLTVVVILYTVLILWLFWLAISWSWARVVECL